MRIAVVDDEQLIVEGLMKIISRKYPEDSVTGFTDPVEALHALGTALPDLLITDIRMPGLTGLELISSLKKQKLEHYAILTGLDDVPLLQESIRLHVDDYLIKPVNKTELFALIDRIRKEISASREQERYSLAQHFAAADRSDREMMEQLVSQLNRSKCPPEQLRVFLEEMGCEIPFWEVCSLAHELLSGSSEPEQMAALLRAVPQAHQYNSEIVRQVCENVHHHYADNMTLAGTASEVYLQPNYLTTLFRKEMGIGFIQYLNQVRVEQACRLLLTEPNLTMAAIAPKCGFPSDRNFFSTFKRYTGSTPGEFREKLVQDGFIRA